MFNKFFTKVISSVLVFSLLMATSLPVFAAEVEEADNIASNQTYTVEDFKALESYVQVVNGRFTLNTEEAKADGVDEALIAYQKSAFDMLNQRAAQGSIRINPDLSIDSATVYAFNHAYNCGGGYTSGTTEYWWGYARFMCDCESNKFANDMGSCI